MNKAMRVKTRMLREGPTNITSTARVCGLCQFHSQHLLKSGEHPEYKHFCGHPASVEWVKSNEQSIHRELLHSMLGSEDEDGRQVGCTDNTPDWCPVVMEKLRPPHWAGKRVTCPNCGGIAVEVSRVIIGNVIECSHCGYQGQAPQRKDGPERPDSNPDPYLATVRTDGPAGLAKRTEVDPQRLVSLTASPGPGLTAGAPVFDPKVVEAVEVLYLIEELRGEPGSGDGVEITCVNDDPDTKDDLEQVSCYAGWTKWKTMDFTGTSILAALRKATEAKRAKGGVS